MLQERAANEKLSDKTIPALKRMFTQQLQVTRKLRALWALAAIGAAVRAGAASEFENGRGRGSGTVCATATSARVTKAMMAQLRFT